MLKNGFGKIKIKSSMSSVRIGIAPRVKDQQILAAPVLLVALVVLLFLLAYSFNPKFDDQVRIFSLITSGVGFFYGALTFFIIIPLFSQHVFVRYFLSVFHAIIIGIFLFSQPIGMVRTPLLFATLILWATTILFGRISGYLFSMVVLITRQLLMFFTPDAVIPQVIYEAAFFFVISIATIESITAYVRLLNKNQARMEVMDTTARSLASTIEIPQVISMLSSAAQNAINADTYFVGIVNENRLRVEFFYDDGEYFPTIEMSLENTLTGWVVKNHQTLSISNFLKEAPKLGVTPYLLGKPRISLSWMGAPIEINGKLFGVLAVASYQSHAFSPQDQELLEFITQQAALAFDNANRHNDVKQQSRLDSLTGVLNHRNFLEELRPQLEDMRVFRSELSLIMLDIDFFKQYNDNYGHLVGDQVLELLTSTIRKHIKATDLVGRWGGEEFVIALPHASGLQAYKVAQRIRKTLAAIKLSDRDGKPIPPPTVSQGIAVFPDDGEDIFGLIDQADQRLYQAKERGRDQIEPKLEFWQPPSLSDE